MTSMLREDSQPNVEGDITGTQSKRSQGKYWELDHEYWEVPKLGFLLESQVVLSEIYKEHSSLSL